MLTAPIQWMMVPFLGARRWLRAASLMLERRGLPAASWAAAGGAGSQAKSPVRKRAVVAGSAAAT